MEYHTCNKSITIEQQNRKIADELEKDLTASHQNNNDVIFSQRDFNADLETEWASKNLQIEIPEKELAKKHGRWEDTIGYYWSRGEIWKHHLTAR